MSWLKAIRQRDVPPGTKQAAEIAGLPLLICRTEGGDICSVEDCCSHADAPLRSGTLRDHVLECSLHGGQFDVRTGQALRMPAMTPIETFPTRVTDDGWIEVDVEED